MMDWHNADFAAYLTDQRPEGNELQRITDTTVRIMNARGYRLIGISGFESRDDAFIIHYKGEPMGWRN